MSDTQTSRLRREIAELQTEVARLKAELAIAGRAHVCEKRGRQDALSLLESLKQDTDRLLKTAVSDRWIAWNERDESRQRVKESEGLLAVETQRADYNARAAVGNWEHAKH